MERSVIMLVDKQKPKEAIDMQLQTSMNQPATSARVLVRNVYLDNSDKIAKPDEHKKNLSKEELDVLKNGVLSKVSNNPIKGELFFVEIKEGEDLKSLKDDYNENKFKVIERFTKYNTKEKVSKDFKGTFYADINGTGEYSTTVDPRNDHFSQDFITAFKNQFPEATNVRIDAVTLTINSEDDREYAEGAKDAFKRSFGNARVTILLDPNYKSSDLPKYNFKASQHDVGMKIKVSGEVTKNKHD